MRTVQPVKGLVLAAFSRLGPQTFVVRHRDEDRPPVIRCHLGIIVPEGCTLDLDEGSRTHDEGRGINFHGAPHHAAQNRSHSDRVTLMVDVLRSDYPHAARESCGESRS